MEENQNNSNNEAATEAEETQEALELDFLSDVPMKVTVELGVGGVTIKDLLQLQKGSVLELDKLAGEPLEVRVNNKLVSKGEVVVINKRYGIRLTDVISPED